MRHDEALWLVRSKHRSGSQRLLGCPPAEEHGAFPRQVNSAGIAAVPLAETASGRMRQWGLEELAASHRRLKQRVEALETSAGAAAYVISITSFAPRPYGLRRDIPVVIRMVSATEYLASFADAGVTASGDTQQEAFEGVRSLILDLYEHLKSIPDEERGPRLVSQLGVLRDFILESA